MDEDGAVMIPVQGGKHFKEMSVGKHMLNYDSMVVLTHFKGHVMGGFGGSLKNIAIGCADGTIGKKMVHAAPDNEDISKWLTGAPFMENMVESAKATIDHFGNRIVYINVLRNMSVDCDCVGVSAAPTKAHDLGILGSPTSLRWIRLRSTWCISSQKRNFTTSGNALNLVRGFASCPT